MRERNNFVISRPLGVFVVIGIGVALTIYVVIGIASIEIEAYRMNHEKVIAKSALDDDVKVEDSFQISKSPEVENVRTIESVKGKVLSLENGIVVIESDLEGTELTEIRLLVNEGDEKMLDVGAVVMANLSDKIFVSDLEDGAIGVEEFVILDEEEKQQQQQ